MEVQIRYQVPNPWARSHRLRGKLKRVLEDLACHERELSVLFTDDRRMARLNEDYLGQRGPTNVLAFPMGEQAPEGGVSPMLGDVVISLDTARRESAEAGEDLEETVNRLLIHGLLHLLGYDHEQSQVEAARMEHEEERLRQLMSETAGGPQRKLR